jgi:hypothetical protein
MVFLAEEVILAGTFVLVNPQTQESELMGAMITLKQQYVGLVLTEKKALISHGKH